MLVCVSKGGALGTSKSGNTMDCVYSEMREGGRMGRQAGRWAGGYASENEGMKKSRKQVYLLPYSPCIYRYIFILFAEFPTMHSKLFACLCNQGWSTIGTSKSDYTSHELTVRWIVCTVK